MVEFMVPFKNWTGINCSQRQIYLNYDFRDPVELVQMYFGN